MELIPCCVSFLVNLKSAMSHSNCNLHPSFQSKSVYELTCNICEALICARGMKAILLADRNVQLYSTDLPPPE